MRRFLLLLGLLGAVLGPSSAVAQVGSVTPMPCPPGCATDRGAPDLHAKVVSPDGRFLYVGWSGPRPDVALDPATGGFATVADRGCIGPAAGCTALPEWTPVAMRGLALSPDGTQLYLLTGDALLTLDRNPVTGVLTRCSALRRPAGGPAPSSP